MDNTKVLNNMLETVF